MIKNIKRSLMLLGAAAMVAGANAEWVDVTGTYVKDATYLPGWQGVITAYGDGVAEVWNGAFRAYQVVKDAPAGEYTLTANAFYRCGTNEYSIENMPSKPELYKAYIFAGDAQAKVKGLFDEQPCIAAEEEVDGEPQIVYNHPNSLGDANQAFTAGKYVNEVKVNHKGGDLVIGIASTGCYDNEWCAFDNFKLVGPNGEVALVNANFDEGLDSQRAWDNTSSENKVKTPDMQKDGAGGGTYRKCGASPYNIGQQVELPAGKYRFGMLCFHRYGSTQNAETGEYYHHKSGEVVDVYGKVPRSPKDWYTANDYEKQDYDHAYIYASFSATKPKTLKSEDEFGELTDKDVVTRVRDCWEICEGKVEEMPDNNPYGKDATLDYETENKCTYWHDSGNERESAAAFVANPEKWYQYVEFELTEPTKVWLGLGKDSNTGDGFYHAWADQTLKMYVANETEAVNELASDAATAPVYYNLQGVRVANPENGIFIVRQGNKVMKVVK